MLVQILQVKKGGHLLLKSKLIINLCLSWCSLEPFLGSLHDSCFRILDVHRGCLGKLYSSGLNCNFADFVHQELGLLIRVLLLCF